MLNEKKKKKKKRLTTDSVLNSIQLVCQIFKVLSIHNSVFISSYCFKLWVFNIFANANSNSMDSLVLKNDLN